MKKTKRFAAMAAAIAVCAGVTTYLPQDVFSSNVMSASAAEEAELSSLKIYGEAITDFQFHVNEDVLNSILSVKNLHACIYDIYDEEYRNTPINDTDFIFDLSAVDTSTPGVYTVTASYAPDESISTTFYIGIVTWEMEIYGESFTDFQFCVNDDILDNILSDNKLYAHIYDSYGEEYLFEPINDTDYIFDLSAVDTSTPGIYPVTVAYAPDDTISTVFDIEIIALQEETTPSKMEIYSEYDKGFQFHVNDDILNCILSDNMLYANIYDTDGTAILQDAPLNDTDFIFDLSAVDTSTPGTYPVTVSYAYDDSISTTFNIGIVPWQMEIHGEGFTDFQFHVNDDILDKLTSPNTTLHAHIYDIYGEKYLSNEPLNDTDFIFDLSAVDISTAGVYPVTVSYAFDDSISTTFDIELFAWEMEICSENESAFTFHVNDDILERILSDNNLYARIYDEHGVEYIHNESLNDTDFIFDLSAVDISTAGVYPVTVTYAYDDSIRTSFDITVKDWLMEVYAEDESAYVFHVNDRLYTEDEFGIDYWFEGLYARIYDEDGEVLFDEMNLNREEDFSFDFSDVDMSKAGTYPVYVTYKYDDSIRTSFDITVKDWLMEVYAEDESAYVFHVNDELYTEDEFGITYNFEGLYTRIYDEDGDVLLDEIDLSREDEFIFDFSDVDMSKAGTYPVYVTWKYADEIRTSFEIEVIAWEMEVIGNSENDFIFHIDDVIFDGENTAYTNFRVNIFDSYGNKLIRGESTFDICLNTADYEIDLSKVDMSKPGTYPVTVIYKENEAIRCEFDIHVKNLYMEVVRENESDFVYCIGEEFDETRYDVKIYDDDEVIFSSWPLYFDAIIDTSEVDMNTPGTYTVYATHEDHPSVKCEFEITVKENGEPVTEVCSNRANAFTFNVGDELCLDDFYIMRTSANGNVTIINYLDTYTVDTSEVDMNTPGTYTIYVSNDDSSLLTEFQITVESIETTTTATTTTTTTTASNNDTETTTTTVTTLPQTGYSAVYNYIMLLAAAITTLGGFVMAKSRRKQNNN